ncbi:MAG: flagellar export chaperone FlgN [Gammaproteobacteria bacterium]|nr:flagellar export chaperone FlgN [Gammaproteobacteria bacterium]
MNKDTISSLNRLLNDLIQQAHLFGNISRSMERALRERDTETLERITPDLHHATESLDLLDRKLKQQLQISNSDAIAISALLKANDEQLHDLWQQYLSVLLQCFQQNQNNRQVTHSQLQNTRNALQFICQALGLTNDNNNTYGPLNTTGNTNSNNNLSRQFDAQV